MVVYLRTNALASMVKKSINNYGKRKYKNGKGVIAIAWVASCRGPAKSSKKQVTNSKCGR